MSLEGKVAVVTGGTRGLGAVIADALAQQGARVAAVGRSAERFRSDVTQPDEVERLRAQVESELGVAQILVNAAGMFGPAGTMLESPPEAWLETISTNLVGPFLTCRAFAPGMVAGGWGRIVSLTSAASLHPPGPLGGAYATAKVGLNQMTRHLAAELEGTGVTANVIHPGDVKTDMWADIRDQALALGPRGEVLRQWADWLDANGGDPPWKASRLVLDIIDGNTNGAFLWIEDGVQPPRPSWEAPAVVPPWRE